MKTSINVLRKPNSKEAKSCYDTLQQTETEVCGICLQLEDSKDIKSDDILWVSCNKCSIWVHASCTNITDTILEEYICIYCASDMP